MFGSNRIACWISEKKLQKLKWSEFEQVCNSYGYELFKLDLNNGLEDQGAFSVFVHKLTDIIAMANQGDAKSINTINLVENYISTHPDIIVIDPISNVRQLLDRYRSYSIIHATDLHKYGIFTPNFCEITTNNHQKTAEQLKAAEVTYPFICKPALGHGSKKAHEMLIVFTEENLKDCKPPCVAQTFINHNAVLYKIFIVGDKYSFVERPSLKNFLAGEQNTIFFDSSDVSKAGSQSSLSVLDPEDETIPKITPDPIILGKIACTLRKAFGMELLGVDVVIENYTGKYAIIDVNAFPGYDGFPNFFHSLLQCIVDKTCSGIKRERKANIEVDRFFSEFGKIDPSLHLAG